MLSVLLVLTGNVVPVGVLATDVPVVTCRTKSAIDDIL